MIVPSRRREWILHSTVVRALVKQQVEQLIQAHPLGVGAHVFSFNLLGHLPSEENNGSLAFVNFRDLTCLACTLTREISGRRFSDSAASPFGLSLLAEPPRRPRSTAAALLRFAIRLDANNKLRLAL